jgi:uncharacterized protein YkwD
MPTVRRFIAVLPVLLPVILSFAGVRAGAKSATSEQFLFDAVNHERSAQGLPLLKWSDTLAAAARKHAKQMAAQNSLSHQFTGEPNLAARATQAGARFTWLSENIAQGPSAARIHQQWMNSPNHRANILDSDMDSVGIAVAEHNGQLFAVEDFCKAK